MTIGNTRPGPLRTLSLTLLTIAANSGVGLGVGVELGVWVGVDVGVDVGVEVAVGVNVDVGVAVGVRVGTVAMGVAVTTTTGCSQRASRVRNSQLPPRHMLTIHRNSRPNKAATRRF